MSTDLPIPFDPDLPDAALLPQHGAAAEEPELPPLDGLTVLQSRFVRAYTLAGDGNATKAAREAGYAASSAAVSGHRLLRNAAVQSAILAETASAIAASAPQAARSMVALATSARSELVRQQAAANILDRAGLKAKGDTLKVGAGTVTVSIDLG